MAKFIVRIELHGALLPTDYDNLHRLMEAQGFRRYIVSDQGQRFLLPSAEYFLESNQTAEQVRDWASQLAAKTGKTSWVLATAYSRAAWTLKSL